jgi:hypothetical protein
LSGAKSRPTGEYSNRDSGIDVRNLIKAIFCLLVGTSLGLTVTYYSVAKGLGFGSVQAGSWTAWPKSGAADADPYARAVIARTGEVPLGQAEGISFVAGQDDNGVPLRAQCVYRIAGNVPAARYWTLTVLSPNGWLTANVAKRYGLTSAEIYRRFDGQFEIFASRSVHSGNWLPMGVADRFILMLRLYDTSVSATVSALDNASMPHISRLSCV